MCTKYFSRDTKPPPWDFKILDQFRIVFSLCGKKEIEDFFFCGYFRKFWQSKVHYTYVPIRYTCAEIASSQYPKTVLLVFIVAVAMWSCITDLISEKPGLITDQYKRGGERRAPV